MRLILVRHGQTSSNTGFLLDTGAPGADLNETGREQADALVERLDGEPIEAIYASTLVRTQQTAAPLAQARGLEVGILADLREISAGDAEMTTDATDYITTLLKWDAGDHEARIPGAENALEFFARFDRAIAEVVSGGHACAAAFSHGAAMRTWASARVDGFAATLGKGLLNNTGIIHAEGDPDSGWKLVEVDGIIFYDEDEVAAATQE
jgi:broad specificity phosphatase PhoE